MCRYEDCRLLGRTLKLDVMHSSETSVHTSSTERHIAEGRTLHIQNKKQTPWLQSPSELYGPSYRRLSAKLVRTLADRGSRVVSATNPYDQFLGWNNYFFIQAAPQLSSRGWVDPVPDPLPLRKSCSARNRTRDLWICSQELRPLDHRGGHTSYPHTFYIYSCSHYIRNVSPPSSGHWRWRQYVPPKRRFKQDLHGATSQKTALFIVAAMKTSNLTYWCG
jgi:hypothetical protein